MRPDDLIKPISPDSPCGEDLLAADDPDFVDYYFNVEDRLPTSYFNLVRGTLFDPKSVDLKGEVAQIEALLKRSRDLRLLGVEAKFQILAGRFKGFVDAVTGMAALMQAFPEDVHPVDPQDRRNAVEELNSVATIVAPLEYAVLMTDKRAGDIIYRAYGTGSGKVTLREDEEPGDAGAVTGALGSSENAKVVDALHGQIASLQAAIKTMVAVCQSGPGGAPARVERLEAKLAEMMDMVLVSRPDLAGGATSPAAATGDGNAAAAAAPGKPGSTTITITPTPANVPDHKAAYRQLQAVERYFATTEPSSLALLLVVQARLLVGRPLVEALDALLENNAPYAAITFGGDTGFSISMSRMRELSERANIPAAESFSGDNAAGDDDQDESYDHDDSSSDETPEPAYDEDGNLIEPEPQEAAAEPEPAPVPSAAAEAGPAVAEVLSRDHAGLVLKQVEEFFQIREPASPIPILLFKARNMLTKDFHAVVRDIMPPSGT